MPHGDRPHQAAEISGRAWYFDSPGLLQSADKAVAGNQALKNRLRSGCYYFATGFFGNKPMAVFLWCPEIRQCDVETVTEFMERSKGREMGATEGRGLIDAAYQRAYAASEKMPLGTEWEKGGLG